MRPRMAKVMVSDAGGRKIFIDGGNEVGSSSRYLTFYLDC